jgi:hypothetical protein
MEESEFKERVKRLRQVSTEIAKLDPAVRAAAFDLLAPYIEGAPPPSGGSGGGRASGQRPSARRSTSVQDKVTLGAFLSERKLRSNSKKATAIVVWASRHGDQQELKVGDVKNLWRKTSFRRPANLARDLQSAGRNGWLHIEGEGRTLKYSPVGYGESMVDDAVNNQ